MNPHPPSKSQLHQHSHQDMTHRHIHGVIDPALFATQRGMWAVKWSFLALLATALFQSPIIFLSGSVALLADTIHNAADAATAIPLWLAFGLARRKPTERFTYGYGRVEDLAGVSIVVAIGGSALVAGYEAIDRLLHPQPVGYLWAVMAASLIGFLGNEAVAIFRMKVGQEIGSAALIADGHHARADGLVSLSVLVGAVGVWLGYPVADPLMGLLITLALLRIGWTSGREVFTRLLDGIDPDVIHEIRHAARDTQEVHDVTEVRVRWLGHRLHAELNISVRPDLSVEKGHEIAKEVRHNLMHHLRYLSDATVHVDPVTASGESHHRIEEHAHGDWPSHSH